MIEILKQALEALEEFCAHGVMIKPIERRDALRQAIAELKSQEPVAWLKVNEDSWTISLDAEPDHIPLYTHPPQRKPLTDEQIHDVRNSFGNEPVGLVAFARAIEAKLKELNNA